MPRELKQDIPEWRKTKRNCYWNNVMQCKMNLKSWEIIK